MYDTPHIVHTKLDFPYQHRIVADPRYLALCFSSISDLHTVHLLRIYRVHGRGMASERRYGHESLDVSLNDIENAGHALVGIRFRDAVTDVQLDLPGTDSPRSSDDDGSHSGDHGGQYKGVINSRHLSTVLSCYT